MAKARKAREDLVSTKFVKNKMTVPRKRCNRIVSVDIRCCVESNTSINFVTARARIITMRSAERRGGALTRKIRRVIGSAFINSELWDSKNTVSVCLPTLRK